MSEAGRLGKLRKKPASSPSLPPFSISGEGNGLLPNESCSSLKDGIETLDSAGVEEEEEEGKLGCCTRIYGAAFN